MRTELRFLSDLAINPRQQLAFAHDPAAVLRQAGVSKTAQGALISGSREAIAAIFNQPLLTASCFVDPGPDPDLDVDTTPMPDDAAVYAKRHGVVASMLMDPGPDPDVDVDTTPMPDDAAVYAKRHGVVASMLMDPGPDPDVDVDTTPIPADDEA